MRRLRVWAREFIPSATTNEAVHWTRTMHSLRPTYDEQNHGYYVDLLVDQITSNHPPRNIALAGAYGSGKSSVLDGLRERLSREHRTVEISLATLNQSEQALLRVSGETTLTAALQKEIVKRLIYSAKPSSLPRSRFDRISGVHWRGAVGIAIVAATWLLGLIKVFGLKLPFAEWSSSWSKWKWTGAAVDWLALTFLLVAAQVAFASSRLSEIGIGSAKLSFASKGGDYFDRYLDEIVYFFQKSRTRLVLFEDLDRFDDPGIFQTLRELNNLLNGSEQISHTVSFIHAIRDSLFERVASGRPTDDVTHESPKPPSDFATDSSARIGTDSAASDRAKFFDLVIPLVPFISHEVSADLIVDAFADIPAERRPSTKLMALAGRYVTDMRVIHSIRNEYVVFTAELLDKTAVGGIKDGHDQLLAMVLYKHHHLYDFECIRTGESKLDRLVALVSRLTRSRIAGLDKSIASLTNNIQQSVAEDRRAKIAGERLRDNLTYVVRVGRGNLRLDNVVFQPGGTYPVDQLGTVAFWKELATGAADQLVVVAQGNQLTVPKSDFARLFGEDFAVSSWLASSVEADRVHLKRLQDLRDSLVAATLQDRVANEAFSGRGFDPSGESENVDIPADAIDLLGLGLALELVLGGYIDHNFALYTTKFHGQILSAAARTYLMQYVDRHRSDALFVLSADDVDQIIERTQSELLHEPSSLNVAVVDKLINDSRLDSVLAVLLSQSASAIGEFVSIYLNDGVDAERFVGRLAPKWEGVIDALSLNDRISETDRHRLLSHALRHLSPDLEYAIQPATQEKLQRAFDTLPVLTEELDAESSGALTKLISRLPHRVTSLTGTKDPLKHALGQAGAFEVTRANLEALVPDGSGIGVDTLLDQGSDLAEFVVTETGAYVAALDEQPSSSSIDDLARLDDVVRLVLARSPDFLDGLLRRAPSSATYHRLEDAPVGAYAALARSHRFPTTIHNVTTYVDAEGEIDEHLAALLTEVGEFSVDDNDEAHLGRISVMIVNAENLATATKLALLDSSGDVSTFDAQNLAITDPQLAVSLLRAGRLPDSVETFQVLASSPWPVFSEALRVSSEAANFINQVSLADDKVAELMTSSEGNDAVRSAVCLQVASRLPALGAVGSEAVIQYALRSGTAIAPDTVAALAQKGAKSQVLRYLFARQESWTLDELVGVLGALGEPYAHLITADGGTLSIQYTEEMKAVLERLRSSGLVKSFHKDRLRPTFTVEMN